MLELNKKVHDRFRIDVKKLTKAHGNLKKDRPTLTNVHYSEDGHIEMTNTHVAMQLRDVYQGKEKLMHGEDGRDDYPDMGRIMNKYLEHNEVVERIKIKPWENMLVPFESLKPNEVTTTIKEDEIEMVAHIRNSNQDDSTAKIKVDLAVDEPFQFTIRYEYLLLALKFMRLIGLSEFDMYYSNDQSPISFVNDNLEVVMAQIRRRSKE